MEYGMETGYKGQFSLVLNGYGYLGINLIPPRGSFSLLTQKWCLLEPGGHRRRFSSYIWGLVCAAVINTFPSAFHNNALRNKGKHLFQAKRDL